MRVCLPKAFDYLKYVVESGVRWNKLGAKRFTNMLDDTGLATLASIKFLEIAHLNREKTSYHKSTMPKPVRIRDHTTR